MNSYPGPGFSVMMVVFPLLYLGTFVFMLIMAWRLVRGVERIAAALERSDVPPR